MAKPSGAKKAKPDAALVELYEGLQANVFEVVFARDKKLIAAFLSWAKATYPEWDEEVDEDSPASRAVRLEMLITDEVEESAFVAFFETLPSAQRQAAVAAMKAASSDEDDEEDEDDDAGEGTVAGAITIAGVTWKPGDTELSLRGLRLKQLPDEIARCTSVKVLDLSSNQLTTLPAAIGALTALEEIDLSSNKSLATLPPELARCKKLAFLRLFECKQLLLPPLPSLRQVVAQNTSLATVKSLAASQSIVELNVMKCGLTEVPVELRALKKLDTLDISENKIAKLPRWLSELPLTALHHFDTKLPDSEVEWLKTVIPE